MLARMPNSGTSLACGHALYGIGAAVAPLVATQFTIHVRLVQRYYLVGLGVSMLLMTSVAVVFQGRRTEEIVPVSHQKAVEEIEKKEIEKALERAGRNTQQAAVRTEHGVEGIENDRGSVTLEHLNADERANPRQQPTPLTSATITPDASRPASPTPVGIKRVARYPVVIFQCMYQFVYVSPVHLVSAEGGGI
jgi:hypothetical protein